MTLDELIKQLEGVRNRHPELREEEVHLQDEDDRWHNIEKIEVYKIHAYDETTGKAVLMVAPRRFDNPRRSSSE